MSKTKESQTVGQNLGRTELPSFFLLDVVLIPDDEEYISKYKEYIYGDGSSESDTREDNSAGPSSSSKPFQFGFGQQSPLKQEATPPQPTADNDSSEGHPNQGKSAGPSSSSRPFQFGFGQQFALRQEATPSRPTAENASGSNRGGLNQDKSAGPSSSSRPGQFAFGQQFAFRQEATPPRPTAENASGSNRGGPNQDKSAGPSSSSRPGHFGFGQQFAFRQEASPPQPTADNASGSNRGGPNQDKSAGPSSSSRPGHFGFGQQFAFRQEATPSRPTAENASGSNRGGPNQDKSAGPSSSSRPGHFGFGQQFAFRQEATPSRPTADNASGSNGGGPKQDNSAGPSSSSRPGHFGFGQQFAFRQEATPSRPTAENASGSNGGGPKQDNSAGPSSSSRPGHFGFGQQFAFRQEATPSRPTAENASGSNRGGPNQDKSAGPSSSSRPGHFGFGQQFAFRQEATPSRPTAENASGSNRGGPNQDKSAGPSSSSRPGHFGFGQQFAFRQEASPPQPTADNASGSNGGGPKQDNSAGPSSSSRPGHFGFGQQSPLKHEVTPPQPTGDSTSLSSRAARRKMRVCRNRWETASNGGDSMHPQLGRTNPNGVPWRKTTVREEYDHGAIWHVQLDSISGMKEYASKSVEELRWEHSQNTVTKDLAVIESYSCLEKPTPFLMAVLQGRLGLCKVFSHSQWLWERRWPMYRTDVKACSQIMMGVFVACIHGRVDMFECLLKALLEGGIVSSATALSRIMQSRDENGRTPCILASMHGHNDVLQSFIALFKTPTVSAGSLSPWTAHVNAQDRLGKTALMYACESGNLQIAETLIKQGVNLDMQDKHDLSALEYAMSRDHKEIILALINAGADLSINGEQILIGAAEKGDLEMLQTLIKLNFDLNRKCIAGRTAVMFAVHEDQEEAVQTLLEAGADAAVRDENDDTILTLAAEHASARMVNLCLEAIPAEMIDFCTLHERWTALMLASKRGDEDIVKALLKAGASVLHKRDIQMMSTVDLVSNGDLENKNAILELLREREAAERLVEQMSIQQISECDQGDSIAYDDLNIATDRIIGRGSFSVVKMATWRGMDVAVKELTSNLSLDTQDILRSEVQTLSSLRHPSIVSYYGYCEDPPCIVMELCADSLSNLLHQCAQGGGSNSDIGQTMTWKCRLQIATDTAEGMTYLHKAKNYYHRDLRTANILITSRYQAKISDMGLTKKALKVSRNSAGTIAASTPRWLAPEILSNGPFTSKSDVYSFGTVLYELATWKQPWAGIEEYGIPHLILVKKERLTIPDLESIPGPQPTDGETLIKFREIADKCLAVDPSDRPEFDEIVSELKQILRREQTPEDQQMSSCIVCLSKSSECAYINCGHCCVCDDCAQIHPCSAQCPICRKAGRPTKIFFS